MRLGQSRASHAILAQRVLDNRLLLQQPGLREHQILFRTGDSGLGANDLNRRHGSDVHLLLVVAIKLLVVGKRLLLGADVVVESNQIPIQLHHTGYRRNHLLLELQVGCFAVVARDTNVAVVHRHTEALQQVLCKV